MDTDASESCLPASLIPSLILFIRGTAHIKLEDGSLQECPRFLLRGPFVGPTRTFLSLQMRCISVGFRPGMLHQAMGVLPVDVLSGLKSMDEIVDPQLVSALLLAMDEEHSNEECVARFQDYLLATLDHQKKAGMGAAFLAAHQKMFLPLIDLSLHFGIGERQLERRVRESFGVNLRDARRITRFGLSVLRIIGHPISWGDLTRIAQDSGFYDQAHMHKEYVELAGLSPAALLQKIASDDPAYWMYRLSPRDAKDLFLPIE
ncbi:MAG: helix-turn-helix domain-containing protein [Undibacterium sp.]|nr:helix-turn-helix domain-containing protein [Undibacterium sp.]